MKTETALAATLTAALDVLAVPNFPANYKMQIIARRWTQAGVAQSRDPAVWAVKRQILKALIQALKCEHAEREVRKRNTGIDDLIPSR